MKPTTSRPQANPIARAYLLGYNGAMFIGWGYILAKVIQANMAAGPAAVHPAVIAPLTLFQTGAVIEIFHCLVRLVRSPVATTAMQVFSRVAVVWGTLKIGCATANDSVAVSTLVTAWSLAELIRYSFYCVDQYNKDAVPRWLKWLRYSGFAVLYPVGIASEIACWWNSLAYVKATETYTVRMPNKWNFGFDYHTFIWVLFAIYPFGGYVMYTYMLSQRKKVLSAEKTKKKDE
eukprot:PhM_4_TR357/c0_g1_i1/m.63546/K10703/PHS1, PAS2; very-long-chain (3R)-3-hydroxyacyl-CoA dehydratase